MDEVLKVLNTQYVIVLSSAEPQYLFANSDQTMVEDIVKHVKFSNLTKYFLVKLIIFTPDKRYVDYFL